MGDARPPVAVLLGPTAVGKTAVAIELCRLLGGEVVSADSRQVYRGFEIGSAAPTAAERAAVPHHLVGFLPPEAAFGAAEFREAAEACLADIMSRGRTPVVVAGTGFYLSTLVLGWSLTGVAADQTVRERLAAETAEALYERLREVDPEAAARLQPGDKKRLVRALEVYEVSGRTLSEHHRVAGSQPVPYCYRLFGLNRGREELYRRIEARVDQMLAAGWPDEVAALLAAGLSGDELAMEGLGYRHLLAVVRDGAPLADAVALTKQDTRRFAKRQLTWFRRLPVEQWLDLADDEPPAATAARLAAVWQAGHQVTS